MAKKAVKPTKMWAIVDDGEIVLCRQDKVEPNRLHNSLRIRVLVTPLHKRRAGK